jgi:hypothetical protein
MVTLITSKPSLSLSKPYPDEILYGNKKPLPRLKEKIKTRGKGGNDGEGIFIRFEGKGDGIYKRGKEESRSGENFQLA